LRRPVTEGIYPIPSLVPEWPGLAAKKKLQKAIGADRLGSVKKKKSDSGVIDNDPDDSLIRKSFLRVPPNLA